MYNGPNGQGQELQRLTGMCCVFLCLCREVSLVQRRFNFCGVNFNPGDAFRFEISKF